MSVCVYNSGVHRWGTIQADETIPQIPQQCYEESNPWEDPISVNVSIFRQLCATGNGEVLIPFNLKQSVLNVPLLSLLFKQPIEWANGRAHQ